MKLLEPFLKRLEKRIRDEEGYAMIDEIAALGEAVIPELVELYRQDNFHWVFARVPTKLGTASSPVLLQLFFEPFLNRHVFGNIVASMENIRDERFITSLSPLLYSTDEKRADAATRILKGYDDEQLNRLMLAILQDKTSSLKLQTRALSILGYSRSASQSIPLIRRFMRQKAFKYQAMLALYLLGDELEEKIIRRFFTDKQCPTDVRAEFYRALVKKADKSAKALILELLNELLQKSKLKKADSELIDALIRLSRDLGLEEAVNALGNCMRKGERYSVLEALIKIGSDEALRVLLDTIERWWEISHYDNFVYRRVVERFGSRVFEPLVQDIEKNMGYPHGRQVRAELLCHLDEPRVAEFFLNIVTSPKGVSLIIEVLDKLHMLKDKRLADMIIRLIREDKIRHQSGANVLALADTDELIKLLDDEHKNLRETAILALGKKKAPEAVMPLIKLLPQHPHEIVRSLEAIGDKRATEALVSQIGINHWAGEYALRIGGELCFEPLMKRFYEPDEKISSKIFANLAELDDKRAIEPLLRELKEGNGARQVSAGWALAKFGDEEAREIIYDLWQKAEDEKSKEAYFGQLVSLKDERIISELQESLYSQTEAKNPKAAWSTAWKLSRYPEEKTGRLLSEWFKAIPPDDTREWYMMSSLDFPDLAEFSGGKGDRRRLYWLIDALYSSNLRVILSAIEWLPIDLDKLRMISLLLPLLHDKRRVPNYNLRVCDAVAFRLEIYDIPLAKEINEEWRVLNESGYFG